MNSSNDQDVVQQEQEHYMGGVGRFYECVFCKQGFNTAQALGGHMNIHRKDKASKKKPSTTHTLLSSSNKPDIQNSLSGSNLRCYNNVAEAQSSYVPYFPSSASTSTSTNGEFCLNHNRSSSRIDHHNRQCLNLIGEDWGMNLSLQFGEAAHVIETMEKKSQEDDLDLELRLGHYPR
ncbi:probable transcriptional regulator RABBIT EARS [Lycium barbarum]|uniref:probable transcriptional regulator RABBIT EARS n=1 Tax=Lycium barbarum TaxID=112863 RepID=UPI00293EF174|nr:probable transcriptional regulator RABBIT EARS [Lycium barbarum]